MSARLHIHLDRIAHNAEVIAARAAARGIEVCGVTKATLGSPLIARVLLENGITSLGESRMANVLRLRRNGITAPILLVRAPSHDEADQVVRWCDISVNSERSTLRELNRAAEENGLRHDVLLMIELGDLREGVPPDELPRLIDVVMDLPALRLAGIGSNFMCASGVMPTPAKLAQLADLAERGEARAGISFRIVSGGNSSSLPLLKEEMPPRINHLRIGHSMMIGSNTRSGDPDPELNEDTFVLSAPLIEMKTKDSLPDGELGADAFGEMPLFDDLGKRLRGIVALGRLDIPPQSLRPLDRGIRIVTASSDHTIVDMSESPDYAIGDGVDFALDYAGLLQAMVSPYINRDVHDDDAMTTIPRQIDLFADAHTRTHPSSREFLESLSTMGISAGDADPPAATVLAQSWRDSRTPVWLARDEGELATLFDALRINGARRGLLWMNASAGLEHEGALQQTLSAPPAVLAESCALVGLQRASRNEAAEVQRLALLALTIEDVDLLGVREVMRRAVEAVASHSEGFVLLLHASVASGMGGGGRQRGLSYRECSLAMELVARSWGLRGVVLCGVDPQQPDALATAYSYVLSALGKRILG
ncbi:alanine/ornithine racemase family PLP-dependent enzyme [Gammaproteobacteria bacterium]|nr:alanine/ornithine racemase family PLP-dependent enzyme [Gammaproteobacteria bacterium]